MITSYGKYIVEHTIGRCRWRGGDVVLYIYVCALAYLPMESGFSVFTGMEENRLQMLWSENFRTKPKYKRMTLYRLHTAILNRPLSSAATKEV
jgi:hypothetical protein